jgi:hypothetical protein
MPQFISFSLSKGYSLEFYLKAEISGNVYPVQKIKIMICGDEKMVTAKPKKLNYDLLEKVVKI